MPNHVHALIKTPEPNLSNGMQHWLSGYANLYAKRNRRTGHLYQGRFMQRLTVTHVTRWQKNYNMVGYGHVYQSRFKSFPVETDEYFYQVNRYVERNALRANLVKRAEDWPYGSLWIRQHGTAEHRKLLSAWPQSIPKSWSKYVNEPASEAELAALRRSVARGTPYGSKTWVESTIRKLGLESTFRKPGRSTKR